MHGQPSGYTHYSILVFHPSYDECEHVAKMDVSNQQEEIRNKEDELHPPEWTFLAILLSKANNYWIRFPFFATS